MNNNFKQTEIGLIPEDWGVMRLGDVAEMFRKEKDISEMENTILLECGTLMEVKKKIHS